MLAGEGALLYAVSGETRLMSPGAFSHHSQGTPPRQPGNTADKAHDLASTCLDFPQASILRDLVCPSSSPRDQHDSRARRGIRSVLSRRATEGAAGGAHRSSAINYTYERTGDHRANVKSPPATSTSAMRALCATPTDQWRSGAATMGAYLSPAAQRASKAETYRATDATIFVCAEGQAPPRRDKVWKWGPNRRSSWCST